MPTNGEANEAGEVPPRTRWRTPKESTLKRRISKSLALAMAIVATVIIFFGPEFSVNAPFFNLSAGILSTIHWTLNVVWGVLFILNALFGRWSNLNPVQKICHWLAAILIVGGALMVDFKTAQKVPLSFYPFVSTIVVQVLFFFIELTCKILDLILDIVTHLVQLVASLLLVTWTHVSRWLHIPSTVNAVSRETRRRSW